MYARSHKKPISNPQLQASKDPVLRKAGEGFFDRSQATPFFGSAGTALQCKEGDPETAPATKFDIDKAVAALNKNALSDSIGKCATSIRMALEAGGFDTTGHPVSAKDYKDFLTGKGFSVVATDSYQKGDIVVIDGFKGKKNYPHGHIAMYNGTQWVSDFKQRTLMPGPEYRTYSPAYVILR